MTPAQIIAAEVAARYGVAVCPSVVQVCPPRTFAEVTPVWDGRTNTLVYPDHGARKAQFKKAIWAGAARARGAAVTPAIRERREKVARLHGAGLHNAAIAAELGFAAPTIGKDLAALGLKPHPAPYVMRDAAQIKTATLLRMQADGADLADIAGFLGLKPGTLRKLATAAGSPFAAKRSQSQGSIANRATVLRLRAEGQDQKAVAAAVGLTVASVMRIAKDARQPFAAGKGSPGTGAARRDEVLRLQGQGLRPAAVAAAMGLQAKSVIFIATKAGSPFGRAPAVVKVAKPAKVQAPKAAKVPKVAAPKAAKPPRAAKVKAPRKSRAKPKAPRSAAPKYQRKVGPSVKQIVKAARQAKVADLHRRGFGFLAITAKLDAGKSTIHRDLTELGLITNSRWKKPLVATDERRAA